MNVASQNTLPLNSAVAETDFDVEAIRRDFPVLHQEINGHPLAYLDNAASSQRPQSVIDAVRYYEEHDHANVHRGVHTLSQRATDAYEGGREKIRAFINAEYNQEIIYVRGATEAINLVAQSYGRSRMQAGDEIVITTMEHHSNIVPWQLLAEQTGVRLRVIPITRRGELELEAVDELLNERTRLLSVVYISNALGTINPVKTLIDKAHSRGIPVMLDAAQAAPHTRIDVQALDCDFLAISGHKMYGPTGIGILYGKRSLLEAMPPYQGGGEMILAVNFERSVYNELPYKFEAGTPNISGAIGLGAAVDYLQGIGLERISRYEHKLLRYATEKLESIPELKIVGTAREKASVISFTVDGVHPHDLGTIVDSEGVAIRTGHHCAMPVMEFFGVPATARASFAFYNTTAEIDALANALQTALGVLR
ncbi:MAG: cysteine desulfurase [Chromatiales bacterium]|nr:cysteine desulfurase [Chromatiales bacterium]